MNQPILEMRHICKGFPGVKANDDVNFAIYPGEIHALLGENGAGKSSIFEAISIISALALNVELVALKFNATAPQTHKRTHRIDISILLSFNVIMTSWN